MLADRMSTSGLLHNIKDHFEGVNSMMWIMKRFQKPYLLQKKEKTQF